MQHSSRYSADLEDNLEIRDDGLTLSICLVPRKLTLRNLSAEQIVDLDLGGKPCPLTHAKDHHLQVVMLSSKIITRDDCCMHFITVGVDDSSTFDDLTLTTNHTRRRHTEVDSCCS